MGYTKKVINKKLELFRCLVHEVKVSENGNWYGVPIIWDIEQESPTFVLKESRLSKGNFYRDYGKEQKIYKGSPCLLMTKGGSIKYKSQNRQTWNRFQTLNLFNIKKFNELNSMASAGQHYNSGEPLRKLFKERIKDFYGDEDLATMVDSFEPDMFFLRVLTRAIMKGRKSEWVVDRPHCQKIHFWKSFSSFKEAKVFLKYEFLNDDDFYDLLCQCDEYVFWAATLTKKDRMALKHFQRDGYTSLRLLKDTIRMHQELKLIGEIEEEFSFPSGTGLLKELHDSYVLLQKKQNAERYSDDKFEITSPLFGAFTREGLDWKPILSHRELFLTGCINDHCIASRRDKMKTDLFVSFFWDEHQIDCQFKDGKIYEIQGYKNKHKIPQELVDKINKCLDENTNMNDEKWTIVAPEGIDEKVHNTFIGAAYNDDLPF